MSLGENIYKHRAAQSLSQAALAEELEVSRQSVSKWENDTAVPDLDRLVKMSQLFDITLDELVFGYRVEKKEQPAPPSLLGVIPRRIIAGYVLLIFGMIFFLLSVFWGDHLYFGETFGELSSAVIVLLSVSMIATDNFKTLATCVVVYFMYTLICFGILDVTSIAHYLFTFIAGGVILVWFIILGTNANKDDHAGG